MPVHIPAAVRKRSKTQKNRSATSKGKSFGVTGVVNKAYDLALIDTQSRTIFTYIVNYLVENSDKTTLSIYENFLLFASTFLKPILPYLITDERRLKQSTDTLNDTIKLIKEEIMDERERLGYTRVNSESDTAELTEEIKKSFLGNTALNTIFGSETIKRAVSEQSGGGKHHYAHRGKPTVAKVPEAKAYIQKAQEATRQVKDYRKVLYNKLVEAEHKAFSLWQGDAEYANVEKMMEFYSSAFNIPTPSAAPDFLSKRMKVRGTGSSPRRVLLLILMMLMSFIPSEASQLPLGDSGDDGSKAIAVAQDYLQGALVTPSAIPTPDGTNSSNSKGLTISAAVQAAAIYKEPEEQKSVLAKAIALFSGTSEEEKRKQNLALAEAAAANAQLAVKKKIVGLKTSPYGTGVYAAIQETGLKAVLSGLIPGTKISYGKIDNEDRPEGWPVLVSAGEREAYIEALILGAIEGRKDNGNYTWEVTGLHLEQTEKSILEKIENTATGKTLAMTYPETTRMFIRVSQLNKVIENERTAKETELLGKINKETEAIQNLNATKTTLDNEFGGYITDLNQKLPEIDKQRTSVFSILGPIRKVFETLKEESPPKWNEQISKTYQESLNNLYAKMYKNNIERIKNDSDLTDAQSRLKAARTNLKTFQDQKPETVKERTISFESNQMGEVSKICRHFLAKSYNNFNEIAETLPPSTLDDVSIMDCGFMGSEAPKIPDTLKGSEIILNALNDYYTIQSGRLQSKVRPIVSRAANLAETRANMDSQAHSAALNTKTTALTILAPKEDAAIEAAKIVTVHTVTALTTFASQVTKVTSEEEVDEAFGRFALILNSTKGEFDNKAVRQAGRFLRDKSLTAAAKVDELMTETLSGAFDSSKFILSFTSKFPRLAAGAVVQFLFLMAMQILGGISGSPDSSGFFSKLWSFIGNPFELFKGLIKIFIVPFLFSVGNAGLGIYLNTEIGLSLFSGQMGPFIIEVILLLLNSYIKSKKPSLENTKQKDKIENYRKQGIFGKEYPFNKQQQELDKLQEKLTKKPEDKDTNKNLIAKLGEIRRFFKAHEAAYANAKAADMLTDDDETSMDIHRAMIEEINEKYPNTQRGTLDKPTAAASPASSTKSPPKSEGNPAAGTGLELNPPRRANASTPPPNAVAAAANGSAADKPSTPERMLTARRRKSAAAAVAAAKEATNEAPAAAAATANKPASAEKPKPNNKGGGHRYTRRKNRK